MEEKSKNIQDIIVRDTRFNDIEIKLNKMNKRAMEFCQTRSNHQIEKFIACEEYTPITQFRHVAHNSYVAMQEVRRMLIERERKLRNIEKKQKKIEESKDPHYEDYDLDIYELSRQLEEMEIRIKGLLKEISLMEQICEKLEEKNGKPFSNEQYQEEEPIYWKRRFANQMHRAQIGQKLGIGEGNYMSYLMSLQAPILDGSNQQISPFNISDINEIATEALKDREGINSLMLKPIEENKKLNT